MCALPNLAVCLTPHGVTAPDRRISTPAEIKGTPARFFKLIRGNSVRINSGYVDVGEVDAGRTRARVAVVKLVILRIPATRDVGLCHKRQINGRWAEGDQVPLQSDLVVEDYPHIGTRGQRFAVDVGGIGTFDMHFDGIAARNRDGGQKVIHRQAAFVAPRLIPPHLLRAFRGVYPDTLLGLSGIRTHHTGNIVGAATEAVCLSRLARKNGR